MLLFKTYLDNFGSFKDLLTFMKLEKINQIHVDTYYIFDKVNSLNLSIDDIKNIIKGEV